MADVPETFLPHQFSSQRAMQPPNCPDFIPLPFSPHQPWDLIQEALASRVAMQSVIIQLPAVLKLSIDAQESLVSSIFEDFKQKRFLSEAELESLRGVSKGRSFNAPAFNPDGSPSLCGVLGRLMMPSVERDVGGAIAGAALGAAAGAAVGGIGGAALGALAGGIAGHCFLK